MCKGTCIHVTGSLEKVIGQAPKDNAATAEQQENHQQWDDTGSTTSTGNEDAGTIGAAGERWVAGFVIDNDRVLTGDVDYPFWL